jgi:hypothetical protein
MPVKNDTYFRHLKAGEKDYKRSDCGGLFMLVTKTGSKLWRQAYNFRSKQKLLGPAARDRLPDQGTLDSRCTEKDRERAARDRDPLAKHRRRRVPL